MTPAYTYRSAVDADIPLLWDILKRALGPHIVTTFGVFDEAAQRQRFDEVTRVEHHTIVEVAGEPAGCVCAIDRDDELRIARIFVYPAHQGRGLGTRLVEDLIARARARGVRARLRVFKQNPAQRLYARLGFEVTGELELYVQMIWTPPG
jgi:ribosomal protein S18 acetylase RimI-like enzyme